MSNLKSCLFGSCDPQSNCAQIGYTIFRVFVGVSMAFGHGLAKISNPAGFLEKVGAMGFPAPQLLGWAAILSEFAGGILIALGLATRPAAALVGLTMLSATIQVHGSHPVWSPDGPSKEFALLYLVCCIAIMSLGSGKFGVDRVLSSKQGA